MDLQDVINATSLGGLYALFALGVAITFGVMRLMNFAHGELIMVGGYIAVLVAPVSPLLVLVCPLVGAVIVALILERVAFRPIRGADITTLLISSFAVSYLLQNLAIMIFGSVPKTGNVLGGLSGAITLFGMDISKLSLVMLVTTFVLLNLVGLFILRSRTGLYMRAAAEDFTMARLLAVDANRVVAMSFGVAGLVAGVGALFLAAQTGSASPTMGLSPVTVAFIATIVGGLGSLRSAVLGGFLIGVLTVMLQLYLPLDVKPFRDAFVYLVVIVILLLRPDGLFPFRRVVERV